MPHYFTNFPAKGFTHLFNVRRLLGVYFATSLKSNLCTTLTRLNTTENKVTIGLWHKTQMHFNSFPHESTAKVKTNLSTSAEQLRSVLRRNVPCSRGCCYLNRVGRFLYLSRRVSGENT